MELILTADKDPHARRLIAEYLTQQGYRVEAVVDGTSALTQTRLLQPRLLIAAILLPDIDGLSLCRTIKADPNVGGTVILICSILAARARAQDAGADGFLSKPLNKDRLIQAVASLLPANSPTPRSSL